jgi:hypothetical protein
MIKRIIYSAFCLVTGLAFALSLWFMPSNRSPEIYPDWLAVLALASYPIIPISWLCCGIITSRMTVSKSQRYYAFVSITAASSVLLFLFYIYSH